MPDITSGESFIYSNNHLELSDNIHGFKQWAFQPGMLFESREFWWNTDKKRTAPHEGLDFHYYLDKGGVIRHIDEFFEVKAISKGTVQKMMADFLGISICIRHESIRDGNCTLHSIYGHVKTGENIEKGVSVCKNGFIGTLAPQMKSNQAPPHLHLTLCWIADGFKVEQELSWRNLADNPNIILIDPLWFHLPG